MIQLDSRTQLFVLLLTSTAAMVLKTPEQINFLMLLSAAYLLGNGLPKKAVYYSLFYIVLKILFYGFSIHNFGTLTSLIYIFIRMVPLFMVGAVLLHTSPSAILCACTKMRIPKPVLIMICILARFSSVVIIEMNAIKDGIRARGIFPYWYTVLQRPALAYECFFVPIIVRCLKLSEELASAAALRGIECNCRRTSLHQVGFKAADGIIAGGYSLLVAGIYWRGAIAAWLN